MDVLVTLPDGQLCDLLIPADLRERLEAVGDVVWNPTGDQFAPEELAERLDGVEVCVTGWGTTKLDADVIDAVDSFDLDLLAHVGGSVASVASPAVYDRGVAVTSANRVMATFVAEAVLAYALATLRDVPAFDRELRAGEYPNGGERTRTLFGERVGFVGLGAVGTDLLDLLAPFDVEVRVYDPYVDDDALDAYGFASFADLETVLSESTVVSVHASLTRETLHLLDADRLATLPDGALLVNAARGAIVDQSALVEELRDGRIRAVLDVYEDEPLPADDPLRSLDAAVLQPHVAGSPAHDYLAETVVAEVERYAVGDPLDHAVSRERFERMTNDQLSAE